MKRQKIFIKLFASLLILTFVTAMFSVAVVGDVSSRSLMQSVDIDGDINDGEWNDADWYNIPFYLNANNTHGDVDGFNYLSIGEDEDNILISIDLCSDRTDNDDGEWLGVWLNTAKREFGTAPMSDAYQEWYGFLDNGTENIVFDAENDQTYPFFQENVTEFRNRWMETDEEYTIETGTEVNPSDDYMTFKSNSYDYELQSEWTGSSVERIWINFSIDLGNWFNDNYYMYNGYNPEFVDAYINSIEDINITIELAGDGIDSTMLDASNITFPNATGYLDWYDPEYTQPLPFSSSETTITFDYNISDLTADNKLNFHIFFYNTTPGQFQMNIDRIYFPVIFGQDNDFLKHSSIQSYDIAYSFGKSPNCDSDHRMFELAIPKSELELYDSDEDLGIFIEGYGTLAIEDSSQWWYGASGSGFYPCYSSSYLYLDMQGDVPPEEDSEPSPFDDPFWTLVIAIVAIIATTIVALVGLLAHFRKNGDCTCRGLPGCSCDI